jgi:hypothetical protein
MSALVLFFLFLPAQFLQQNKLCQKGIAGFLDVSDFVRDEITYLILEQNTRKYTCRIY